MMIKPSGKLGAVVANGLFGGNALWHIDHEVSVLEQKIDKLGIGNLRWPGGSITEHWFDPANPDQPLAKSRDSEPMSLNHQEILSFSEVLAVAQKTGRAVDIVLPTRHILAPADADGHRAIDQKAVADIVDFVRQALQKGGAYPDAKIASFEIGNEYWGSGRMTASEYGQVANVLSKAVQQGIDAAGSGQQPKILVQMGEAWGPDFDAGGKYHGSGLSWGQVLEQANRDVVNQLDAEARKVIDGLIDHHYTRNKGEIAFDGWSFAKKLSVWAEAGMKLPVSVTEWNMAMNGLKEEQDRFASGSGMLETFEYMVRLGIQSAHVWPITQSTSNDLSGKAGGGAGYMSSNGAVFTLLSQNVRGLSWQNTSIEDIPEIESSFYTGQGKSVLFLTADEDKNLERTFDLLSLIPEVPVHGGILRVTQTLVVRDQTADIGVGWEQGARIVSGSAEGSARVLVDLSPYETSMVKLEWVKAPGSGSRLSGTQAADEIRGALGADFISGNSGNDVVRARSGNDILLGGLGDDQLFGDAGTDALRGEVGNDRLYGGEGNDTLDGGDGNDQIFGEGGNDILSGRSGKDTLWGGAGNDTLHGGAGAGNLKAGDGNDVIYGGVGSEIIFGGHGSDLILSGGGNDVIAGGTGIDKLRGGAGNDTLIGGYGNDRLYGDSGNDTFIFGRSIHAEGGSGIDLAWGGTGTDIFVFGDMSGYTDIMDFEDSVDRIRFADPDVQSMAHISIYANREGDVVIAYDGGHIRLQNTDLADVTRGDFIF